LERPIPLSTERYEIESQIRECFGRCAYSHKTHEKMAERSASWLHTVKWAQIGLSALTTVGAISVLFEKGSLYAAYATTGLSFLTLMVNSYMKDLDPGQAAQKHRETASDLWNIRESYMSLLTDIRDNSIITDKLRERRDELQVLLHSIYRSAPHTDGKAYGQAQDALQNREDLTFSEAEIDHFLPTSLKRSLKK
jgi:hypothetical protein